MSLDYTPIDRPQGDPGPGRPRRLALVAVAAALAVGGLACAGNGDDERADTESIDLDQTSTEDDSTDTTASDDEASTGSTDEPEAGGSGGGSGNTGEVLGTARSQLPYDLSATELVALRADVTRLERHDDLVELTITLTNESDPSGDLAFHAWRTFEDQNGNYDVSAIGLVDPAGQKVYLPARDADGICLCTDELDEYAAPPGEWILLNATIGGVPDDVEQVDVAIPGFPTIVGVTIQ